MSQNSSALYKAGSNSSLDAVTRAAETLLDGSWEDFYQTGQHIQKRIADFMFNALGPGFWTPRQLIKTALDAARQSSHLFRYLDPLDDGKLAWDELNNKLEAFSLFEFVDSTLGLSPEVDYSLSELVARAAKLGNYSSVWALEGLGNYYTSWRMRRGRFPDHLLCGNQSGMLPPRGLMPLHTGMGLALAESVLEAMSRETSNKKNLLNQFVSLCHSNSQDGYGEAAFEALGLVARNLYPQLIVAIDLELRRDEELLAYFWHGIGRGVYFVPTNFLPFLNAPWRALNMCLREPPHETGKRNAVAGLVWAITLVNIRQPEILAAFLKHHEGNNGDGEAAANGICSAIMIWLDSAADDHYVKALGKYEPHYSLQAVWKKYVKDNCDLALDRYPAFKSQRHMGELFRYQDLRGLTRV